MFTFTDRFTFQWPVKVRLPSAEGEVVQEFTGTFLMPEDEKDIFERIEGESMADMIDAARLRLSRYLVGWSGIGIEGGGELAFSEEARDRLLRQRPIRMAVDAALAEAVMGIREKN